MENILRKVRQFSLKGVIVKWLISDDQFKNYIFNEVDEMVGDELTKIDDYKYDFENLEYTVSDLEEKVDRFEYETIDEIQREAEDALKNVRDQLIGKYVAKIDFCLVDKED
tara:strand:+ start:75 stop:407 length:333 start_codon:yes stop_codon:yes gene_type:complete